MINYIGEKMDQTFDVAVIGSGPGGYVAAIRASQLNLNTVLIEKENLGGICLNWGCIPTKALLKSAETYALFKEAKDYGLQAENVSFDFAKIIERSRKVASINSKGVEFLMKKNKITVISGQGKIKSPSLIEVTDKDGKNSQINAKHIIIATGGRPRSIPSINFDGKNIIEYRKAMSLKQQPESMVIVGAGAIGIEFAYFYNQLGTKITIIEMMDSILPIEDSEVSDLLAKSFKKNKVDIHTSTTVESIKSTKSGVTVTYSKDGKKETVSADKALIAIGIQGNVEDLGLEDAGVNIEKSFMEKIAGESPHTLDYDSIPGCTYCQPQIASIGMTETKAKEAGYDLKIGRFPYAASGKARAIGERDGFVKLIFDSKYGELLGAHIIGAEATELIAEIGIAKSLESTPVELAKTIHAHPTLSEMIMEAAGAALGEAVHI